MEKSINIHHELTMLYLKSKDISTFSPSELLDEYKKVYKEIKKHDAESRNSNWFA